MCNIACEPLEALEGSVKPGASFVESRGQLALLARSDDDRFMAFASQGFGVKGCCLRLVFDYQYSHHAIL